MAAPRFINELTAVTSLSSAAAVHILQGGVDLRTTAGAFITQMDSLTQSGSGAHSRSVQEKEREIVSVTDFENTDGTQVALDGSQNDTAGIQRAVTFCETVASGTILHFPGASGTGKITTAIAISDTIWIQGSGHYTSGLLCDACNGFNVAQGALRVHIEGLSISLAVRFATTANTLQGINLDGASGTEATDHIIRDVYIDGFRDAIGGDYVHNALIDHVRVGNCKNGINWVGANVNNNIVNCQIDVTGNDGICIVIGTSTTTAASEGFMIDSCVLFGGNTGLQANYCSNSTLRGSIVDSFTNAGVLTRSTASGAAKNWTITDNYVGSTSANEGIRLLNNAAESQILGNYIAGNQITDAGGTLTNGILQDGTEENNNIIVGNRIQASTRDIRIDAGDDTIVAFNQMTGPGFTASIAVNYWMNVGTNAASEALVSDVQNTYTPVASNTTNLDSTSPKLSFYTRRGNQVTVTGKFDADPTAAANTLFSMTLPIASNIAAEQDLAGTASGGNGTEVARIYGDATNDAAAVQWTATGTANAGWSFQFSYLIK